MKKLGLYITHFIEAKKDSTKIHFNIMGAYQNQNNGKKIKNIEIEESDYANKTNTFNHHLCIITEVNEINEDEKGIYIIENKEKRYLYDYEKALNSQNQRSFIPSGNICSELFRAKSIEEKVKVIKEYFKDDYFNNIEQKKIEKIEFIPAYRNLLILLKDGTLYLDKKIYASNVKEICYLNDSRIYIVYKDNRVESLIFNYMIPKTNIIYDKIIVDYFFIAYLKDNIFSIEILGNMEDDSIASFNIENIEDMGYDSITKYLILSIGNKKIKLNLGNQIVLDR